METNNEREFVQESEAKREAEKTGDVYLGAPKRVGNKGGRPWKNLTEAQIRYAIKCTFTNREASRFLGVAFNTYKYYAKLYYTDDGSQTLFASHIKLHGKGVFKRSKWINKWSKYDKTPLSEIFEGKHPEYDIKKLRIRILKSKEIPCVCKACGFSEARLSDATIPILIDFLDGNRKNHKLENLRLLCFNCYYLQVGSPTKSGQGIMYR